ncbi:MAG: hypothetical protein ABSG67_20860 [Thermoguttaceae bacterium]
MNKRKFFGIGTIVLSLVLGLAFLPSEASARHHRGCCCECYTQTCGCSTCNTGCSSCSSCGGSAPAPSGAPTMPAPAQPPAPSK